jgi:hypothetical protein
LREVTAAVSGNARPLYTMVRVRTLLSTLISCATIGSSVTFALMSSGVGATEEVLVEVLQRQRRLEVERLLGEAVGPDELVVQCSQDAVGEVTRARRAA